MTLGKNIRYLRKKNGWSQDYLAELLGYKNYTSIQKWESGVAEPRFATVQSLADIFHVDIDALTNRDLEYGEILSATHKMMKERLSDKDIFSVRIPVFSYVSAGTGTYADESNIEGYVDISQDLAKNGDFFGVRVKGDSMMPDIKDKDIVIVKCQSTANDGDTVVAVVNGDEGFCKKFVLYDNSIGLVSNNPSYKPMIFTKEDVENIPVRIMGVVVELRRSI